MSNKSLINKQLKTFIFSKLSLNSIKSQKVVIDFSSPNIAKPFHPGHLRATLLGNFVSNINQVFGHEVYRINYLGDWGTQFGYLLHGLDVFKNNIRLEDMTMEDISDVYVKSYKTFGNKEYLPLIKDITSKLENGNEYLREKWMSLRLLSMENLTRMYKKLGVEFDLFEFESDYVEKSKCLMKKLEEEGKSVSYHDGALCYDLDGTTKVTLLTSEGSSLYITRDISAAISRFDRFQPDRIHYVVENGQSLHFERLQKILKDMGYNVDDKSAQLIPTDFHIKFGLVNNMSTRAGNVISVSDILDHAKTLMIERLKSKDKVTLTSADDIDETCEQLSKTLIYFEFLRSPRRNAFNFVWNRDNTGFRLQYCQVCLANLEQRCLESSIEADLTDCFNIENYDYFEKYPSASLLAKHILE